MIKDYIKRLFGKVEAVNCSAAQEEMINGKVFSYRKYTLGGSKHRKLLARHSGNQNHEQD